MCDEAYKWPGRLYYNPEKGTITWRREQNGQRNEEQKRRQENANEVNERKKGNEEI